MVGLPTVFCAGSASIHDGPYAPIPTVSLLRGKPNKNNQQNHNTPTLHALVRPTHLDKSNIERQHQRCIVDFRRSYQLCSHIVVHCSQSLILLVHASRSCIELWNPNIFKLMRKRIKCEPRIVGNNILPRDYRDLVWKRCLFFNRCHPSR